MLDHTMADRELRKSRPHESARTKYKPPAEMRQASMPDVLKSAGRDQLEDKQLNLLRREDHAAGEVQLFFAGVLSLLDRPCVAIVGSRAVSKNGKARTERLSRELVASGFVVVSGLALGVDTAAHTAAIAAGGSTIGVIGTPLDRAYPAENAPLQEEIYEHHLLISPFARGERTFRSSFPKRNRVMAALCDATVIVEASDTSGSLHQAAECARLGRWLFIAKSLAESRQLEWPKKFLASPRTAVLCTTDDLVRTVMSERP
jgi:DNA processing protein